MTGEKDGINIQDKNEKVFKIVFTYWFKYNLSFCKDNTTNIYHLICKEWLSIRC